VEIVIAIFFAICNDTIQAGNSILKTDYKLDDPPTVEVWGFGRNYTFSLVLAFSRFMFFFVSFLLLFLLLLLLLFCFFLLLISVLQEACKLALKVLGKTMDTATPTAEKCSLSCDAYFFLCFPTQSISISTFCLYPFSGILHHYACRWQSCVSQFC
jgi:hypothetical protein